MKGIEERSGEEMAWGGGNKGCELGELGEEYAGCAIFSISWSGEA